MDEPGRRRLDRRRRLVGGVPTATQSVCITIATSAPVTGTNITVAGLTLGGTGTSIATVLNLGGTNTFNGSATITGAGKFTPSGTLDLTAGTLTNDGVFAPSTNITVQGAGTIDNAADGFLTLNGQLLLEGPGGFTNDGAIVVPSSSTLKADPTSPTTLTFDNDGGVIANGNGGGVLIQTGATFAEGAGRATGSPFLGSTSVTVNGGTLDLAGSGSSTFSLVGGTLEGTIASDQTVVYSGSPTTSGSVTSHGRFLGPLGARSRFRPGRRSRAADCSASRAARRSGSAFVNAADGTLALPNGAIVLDPPYGLTNDGTMLLAPGTNLIAEAGAAGTATVDNDGGTISNGTQGQSSLTVDGSGNAATSATFIEGGGSTSGAPIGISGGTLDLTGSGSSNFLLSGGTLQGTSQLSRRC